MLIPSHACCYVNAGPSCDVELKSDLNNTQPQTKRNFVRIDKITLIYNIT